MREKRNLIISTVLGAILGWILGFLRLPFLEKNFSFLLGFIACLSIVLLGLLIIYVWRKKTFTPPSLQKNAFRSILTLSLILIGGFISSFLFFQQNKFSKIHANQQNKKLTEQFELEASTRKSNALILINNLVGQIEEELKKHPERKLSDEMIEQIAALNYSFKPYSYFDGEKFSEKKWSPERGQLLLSLAKMKIDSSSFRQIKMKASFLGADLRNVDLSGADLRNIDLQQANLNNAILVKVNLNNAILKETTFWNSNLTQSNLNESNLNKADLRWAELQDTQLEKADMNGANLSNAKLRKANLTGANLEWAILQHTFLNEAVLVKANLYGANLSRANLTKTILTKTILKMTNLSEANLNKAELKEVELFNAGVAKKDWLEKLDEWQVKGAKEIQATHHIVIDISEEYNFRLKNNGVQK